MQVNQITYRTIDSTLGELIIGATKKGCCLVEFKDRKKLPKVKQTMEEIYSAEFVKGTNSILDQVEKELEQYFTSTLQQFSIPLDVQGSSFQLDVWMNLQNIPYGHTQTYKDIAREISKPLAVRAVGKANGENHLAIIIPCHRVIGSNGKLTGYGGGLWRKRALLDLEKAPELDDHDQLDNYF
ncbi:MAG: methylated-DNA--[protein]-cysteine S-methyltransferase [Candidatus Kariarchaeaceae archaeon]|jgi:AraC family transcriptional regulator of adaptative response/methylated-DNA-[protein]-cysteine methyltransferase